MTTDTSSLPRSEYPRPQFVREDWLCLNGPWDFALDYGDSGAERGLCSREAAFPQTITVPFCPESPLSGIGHTDFLHAVWYRRTITIPADWQGRTPLLHFGAVDYDATVWVLSEKADARIAARVAAEKPATRSLIEGVEVGRHRGGWTPFTCDLRHVAAAGDTITVIVRARDPARNVAIARGKQSTQYAPYACFYTRTTGIWQTVWVEPVPVAAALKRPRITPDFGSGTFHIEQPLTQNQAPASRSTCVTLSDANGPVCEVSVPCRSRLLTAPRHCPFPTDRRRPWSVSPTRTFTTSDIELRDADRNRHRCRRQLRGPAQHRPRRQEDQDQRRNHFPADSFSIKATTPMAS